MKLMFAECCGTIVTPVQSAWPIEYQEPMNCKCGESWCWWDNAETGQLRVYGQNVSLLGIANGLLHAKLEHGCILDEQMQQIIEGIPDNYLFKQHKSLIIKYKPNTTGDTLSVSKEILDAQVEKYKKTAGSMDEKTAKVLGFENAAELRKESAIFDEDNMIPSVIEWLVERGWVLLKKG